MSLLEELQAQTDACLSEIGEAAAEVTATKASAEEHVDRSAAVGSETQINGGQSLASACDEVLSLTAEGMREVEAIALQAQLLEQ